MVPRYVPIGRAFMPYVQSMILLRHAAALCDQAALLRLEARWAREAAQTTRDASIVRRLLGRQSTEFN